MLSEASETTDTGAPAPLTAAASSALGCFAAGLEAGFDLGLALDSALDLDSVLGLDSYHILLSTVILFFELYLFDHQL